MKLWKSTVVIWSDSDPQQMELAHLAREAESGDSYCAKMATELIDKPKEDPDWDGTEFFDAVWEDDDG